MAMFREHAETNPQKPTKGFERNDRKTGLPNELVASPREKSCNEKSHNTPPQRHLKSTDSYPPPHGETQRMEERHDGEHDCRDLHEHFVIHSKTLVNNAWILARYYH